MKVEKMSLKSIKNVLSRAEMKKIMAGSSGGGGGTNCLGYGVQCSDSDQCCVGMSCIMQPCIGKFTCSYGSLC